MQEAVETSGSRFRRAILPAILILAAAFRLPALDSIPPGINQDEAVRAYDAWCLLHSGRDRSGAAWPIFPRALGEYYPAPLTYLMIPFQAIGGMNVWSTRLPAALLGVISVWALYGVLRRLYDERVGLVAALLLAISPWHITLCRLAFEVSLCPTLLLFAGLLLLRALHDDKPRTLRSIACLLLSGLLLGLCAWTYNSMRVFVPLLIIGGALLYRLRGPELRLPRCTAVSAIVFGLGFLLGLAPFIHASIARPQEAWHRAATEVLAQNSGVGNFIAGVARTYALQVSPRFLFWQGDPSPVQCVPGYGQLHLIEALLVAVGLFRVLACWRSEPIGRFILIWLLLAPIPAALTRLDAGHALRSAAGIPAYAAMGALGLDYLLGRTRERAPRFLRPLAIGVTLLLAATTIRFADLYFRRYPLMAAHAFEPEWRAVVREVMRRGDGYDLILLTPDGGDQNGILFLFYAAIPPSEYFAAPRDIQQVGGWDYLTQWGNYFFVSSTEMSNLVGQLPPHIAHPRILIAERPNIPVIGREILRVRRPNGVEAMVLYDVALDRRANPPRSAAPN